MTNHRISSGRPIRPTIWIRSSSSARSPARPAAVDALVPRSSPRPPAGGVLRELLRAARRRLPKSACSLHMVSLVQVADARHYAARVAFHLLHHQGMRQPKIEHAGQMGELKPLPPIGDFVHAELRSAHNRMGLEVVLEAESLSGRKRPLRTGRRLLVNCAVSAENLISGKGQDSDVVQSRVGAAARGMLTDGLEGGGEIKRSKY
jgi:hypothetical protein